MLAHISSVKNNHKTLTRNVNENYIKFRTYLEEVMENKIPSKLSAKRVMVYVHVYMCERDTVGRGYQYVGHTMQATETGYKEKASIEARAVRLPTLKNRVV